MPDTTQITLVLEEDELQKLAELSGGESKIGDYLASLGLRIYAKKCAPDGVVDLEQALLEIDELLRKQRFHKQKIYILQKQLEQALTDQRRLLAIVDDVNQQRSPRGNSTLH